MPDRIRTALIAAVVLSTAVLAAAPAPASAAGEKVAIIVGPVGSMTSSYRAQADQVAAAAAAAGAVPVKVYSPNATWPAVQAAANGASAIIYFGHGNGYPNPYSATENPDRVNGWGINRTAAGHDMESNMVYCGEKALLGTLTASDGANQRTYCGGTTDTDGITPAPGFVMIYAQAHYTGGWSERYVPSDPMTTLDQAQQRVRHYSYPVLALGASAYFGTAFGDADDILTRVLTQPGRSFGDIYADGVGYSAPAQVHMAHPDITGAQVFVQETVAGSMHFGQPDYWYGFAGDPARAFNGGSPGWAPAAPIPSRVTRYAGSDRYATAAAVSAGNFAPGAPVAYVAIGSNFPDALAAGAAAAKLGGPVLLVTSNRVPGPTALELARLRPATIKVIGGPAIISDGVFEAMRPYATSGNIQRIYGANRYATAAMISADAFAPGVPVAYLATGANFPDALAGVAAAGASGGPILLATHGAIPTDTVAELTRLRPGRIVVLGGSGVISDAVATQLGGYATSGSVNRLAGADRYATSAAVASATFASATTVYIATGRNFPDALGGGPVAGIVRGPLLLVPGSTVPQSVADQLYRLDPASVVVLGGTGAVTAGVAAHIDAILAD